MSAADIEIRVLTEAEADAALYRDIRLEALSAIRKRSAAAMSMRLANP